MIAHEGDAQAQPMVVAIIGIFIEAELARAERTDIPDPQPDQAVGGDKAV